MYIKGSADFWVSGFLDQRIFGSADFSGGWGWCQEYSVASLNMKNLGPADFLGQRTFSAHGYFLSENPVTIGG